LTRIVGAAGVILLLNLPFGYYRAGARRFSLPWFVAVHAGVPLVIAIRLLAGIGWRFASFPIFIGAYAAGHFLGGKIRTWRTRTE
jgi:hypothetical protein